MTTERVRIRLLGVEAATLHLDRNGNGARVNVMMDVRGARSTDLVRMILEKLSAEGHFDFWWDPPPVPGDAPQLRSAPAQALPSNALITTKKTIDV